MGSEYLAQLTERGYKCPDWQHQKSDSVSEQDPDYFPEIAKLRAARLLWSVVTRWI